MNTAKLIDHTNLKPDATEQEIAKLCTEAKRHGFFSVCVNPCNVAFAARELSGCDVRVCAVCGFPLGANTAEIKALEAAKARSDGADEIDMVINVGKLKDKDDEYVLQEIKDVVEAVPGAVVKVIIETCLLTREEKIRACRLAEKAGAHFVKTSTGFSKSGATPEDVALMRENVSEKMSVKASGGIHNRAFAEELVKAGASRIGASKSAEICEG